MKFDKALITHICSLSFIALGYFFNLPTFTLIGAFAISGSITNSLAIHMLFEKVPFLYGSGVIVNRFQEFKQGIKELIEKEFFNKENINSIIASKNPQSLLEDLFTQIDLDKAFVALKNGIMESSLGNMLNMFGGEAVIAQIKDPVKENLQKMLSEIQEDLVQKQDFSKIGTEFTSDINNLIDKRLNELTPEIVKDIIQNMIKKHLGWLVVWGGVFGGLIGFLYSLY